MFRQSLRNSAKPRRLGASFATLFLEVFQLFLQIRFALFQRLNLAVAILNVGNVVLPSALNVETASAIFLDVFFQLPDLRIRCGDSVQDRLRPTAPILFAVWIVAAVGVVGSSAPGVSLVVAANDRDAAFADAREIVFGVNLFWLRFVFVGLFRCVGNRSVFCLCRSRWLRLRLR